MTATGTRVIAIRNATKDTVYIYGYGIYVGDEVPPIGTPGPFGIDAGELGLRNPKIELDDNRGTVWGCQCWFMSAEKYPVVGRAIVYVPLPNQEIGDGPHV